jgi:hypothetical protein
MAADTPEEVDAEAAAGVGDAREADDGAGEGAVAASSAAVVQRRRWRPAVPHPPRPLPAVGVAGCARARGGDGP